MGEPQWAKEEILGDRLLRGRNSGSGWTLPFSEHGSLDIALNELPMRRLGKDLSRAAHECGVRCRIKTQAIGHPRGRVAKVAINTDYAGSRGCGIAARLA